MAQVKNETEEPRRIEWLRLSEVKKADANPKQHDIGEIVTSVRLRGFVELPALDERTRKLVAGHGRIEALVAMKKARAELPKGLKVAEDGEWLVPVLCGWASRDDADAKAYLVASNRLTEIGGWDDAQLSSMLADLARSGPDALLGTGYDADDVDRMLNEMAEVAKGETDPDAVPAVDVPWVKRGDLFHLGDHRLMCGDSTDAGDVSTLIDGSTIDCVWTDPPYGVDYEGKAGAIMNDGKAGLEALLRSVFGRCFEVLKPGGAIYVAHPPGDNTKTFVNTFIDAGFRWKQHLPWVKDSFVLGHSDYHYAHEMIIYGCKPGEGRWGRGGIGWFGDNSQTSVFTFPKPKRSEEHPTMKPVELVEACLRNSSAPGHRVFEPFSGSGTTLMACERLGRQARAMELDPKFAQVAIERWQAFTGKQAVKA